MVRHERGLAPWGSERHDQERRITQGAVLHPAHKPGLSRPGRWQPRHPLNVGSNTIYIANTRLPGVA